jgi:uncharacterized membrane protein
MTVSEIAEVALITFLILCLCGVYAYIRWSEKRHPSPGETGGQAYAAEQNV